MRCNFCGWDNPEGKSNCEKCNKPLSESFSHEHSGPTRLENNSQMHRPTSLEQSSSLKKTVRENVKIQDEQSATSATKMATCPLCGYPLEDGKCANCGYSASGTKEVGIPLDGRKTIRPNHKKQVQKIAEESIGFSLIPISDDCGKECGSPIAFNSYEVSLNRENVDPDNDTITSLCQAVVKYTDGKWTIEDKSDLKTTFVQARQAVELENGDIILLGNQLYKFSK